MKIITNFITAWLISLSLAACQGQTNDNPSINDLVHNNPNTADVNIPSADAVEPTPSNNESPPPTTSNGETNCIITSEAQEILDAHNLARTTTRNCGDTKYESAAPLSWNCQLEDSSLLHSLDMAEFDFFNHTGSNGLSPFDRIKNAGYVYRSAGENIAAGQADVDSVMAAWLNSPGHCKNIMNPNFTEMGAGTVYDDSTLYRIYWTVNFASPL